MTEIESAGKVKISLSRDAGMEAFKQTHFFIGAGEFKNLKNVITQRVWSPIVWRDGVRKKENFLSSGIIALDSDSGEWTIPDATAWVDSLGVEAIIGVTKSHGIAKGKEPACDRFRVLIPTASVCTNLDNFEYTMRMYIESMGCDISCKDGGRFYYPCKDVVYQRSGNAVAWGECPPEETSAGIAAAQNMYYESKWRDEQTFPNWLVLNLMHGCAVGSRHRVAYILGCFFARTGWDEDEAFEMLESFGCPLIHEIGEKDVRRCIGNAYKKVGPVQSPEARVLRIKRKGEDSTAQALQPHDREGDDW